MTLLCGRLTWFAGHQLNSPVLNHWKWLPHYCPLKFSLQLDQRPSLPKNSTVSTSDINDSIALDHKPQVFVFLNPFDWLSAKISPVPPLLTEHPYTQFFPLNTRHIAIQGMPETFLIGSQVCMGALFGQWYLKKPFNERPVWRGMNWRQRPSVDVL